jgi:Fe-Mn family superoxide dismutase
MFTLPPLPYGYDALSPVVSDKTLHFHHDKHHATYVKTLNELLDKKGGKPDSLEEVIAAAARDKEAKLFNNAAQAWNHAFFWLSMSPDRAAPSGDLAGAVDEAFGGLDKLKTAFVTEGAGHFASGWVWLAAEAGGRKLKVLSTHDAEDLVTQPDLTPLLVCDLWEHAYYLDHQNDRKGFLEAWFDALPDWGFAGRQLQAARGEGEKWRYPAPE